MMEQPGILSIAIQPYSLKDDGTFPNNATLPVLYYPGCLQLPDTKPATAIEQLFRENNWGGDWRNGIYDFHHYHSTSHEVMGIYQGSAKIQLGGPSGVVLDLQPGDVLLIPAGVAHCNIGATPDFGCVGAYPPGQEKYDILRENRVGKEQAIIRIRQLALPNTDPVYGPNGPMLDYWKDYDDGTIL